MPHFAWGFFILDGMRNDRKSGVLIASLFAALALPAAAQISTPAPAQSSEVIDEVGRRITIPAEARRIVSLAPSITETIYALEAQNRLVGVTDYCDYPPQAQSKQHIGGPINPNLEQIVTLHPDLVIATRQGNRLETVEALTRLGIPVYATDPKSVEEVIESTRRLGGILGARERGDALALELRARLAEIRRRVAAQPPRRVFFVVWADPLISIGKNTFLADALRRAGAESVVETTQDWPRLSIEEVLRQQPEYLVFSSTHFEEAARTVEDLRERPSWRALDAIRDRRIAVISDAINRPSPRLVDAIEQLARQLHPETFTREPEKGKSKLVENMRPALTAPMSRANFEFRVSNFELSSPIQLASAAREGTPCAR
jgi:iron complex transport system substrate-binding protein